MNAENLTNEPTSVLVEHTVALARREPTLQSDDYWTHVRVLHRRSGRDVFEKAAGLCESPDGVSRAVGANILAQLGVRDGGAIFPFADDSAGPLVALLADTEPVVIASALYALGHLDRGDSGQLALLSSHPSGEVREAVAYALGRRTDAVSTATLIGLSSDADSNTRNWATFALGSLSEDDSPAVRDALAVRLTDTDDEVRGEAMVGLAKRQDERAVAPVLLELSKEDVMTLVIEAAEALPHEEFVPHLEKLHTAHPTDRTITLALNKCRDDADKTD